MASEKNNHPIQQFLDAVKQVKNGQQFVVHEYEFANLFDRKLSEPQKVIDVEYEDVTPKLISDGK